MRYMYTIYIILEEYYYQMRYIYNTGGILLSNEVYIYIILEEYYYQMRYIYI